MTRYDEAVKHYEANEKDRRYKIDELNRHCKSTTENCNAINRNCASAKKYLAIVLDREVN